MDNETAYAVLAEVASALDDKHYVLQGGALLGFVRDGDFLPWDHDIDFGTFESPHTILSILIPLGYKFIHINGDEKLGWHMALSKNGIIVEFFGYLKNGSMYHFFIWSYGTHRTSCHVPAFSAEYRETNGVRYKAPHPVETYLEFNYGDWKTKDTGWCPVKSPMAFYQQKYSTNRCVTNLSEVLPCAALLVRQEG